MNKQNTRDIKFHLKHKGKQTKSITKHNSINNPENEIPFHPL